MLPFRLDVSFHRLYQLFGSDFTNALTTMQKSSIKLLRDTQDESRSRLLFEVTSSNDTYHVFPDVYFCTCPAFKRKVLILGTSRVCKHIIATRLCKVSGEMEHGYMDPTTMTNIYTNLFDCSKSLAVSKSAASTSTADSAVSVLTTHTVVCDKEDKV